MLSVPAGKRRWNKYLKIFLVSLGVITMCLFIVESFRAYHGLTTNTDFFSGYLRSGSSGNCTLFLKNAGERDKMRVYTDFLTTHHISCPSGGVMYITPNTIYTRMSVIVCDKQIQEADACRTMHYVDVPHEK